MNKTKTEQEIERKVERLQLEHRFIEMHIEEAKLEGYRKAKEEFSKKVEELKKELLGSEKEQGGEE